MRIQTLIYRLLIFFVVVPVVFGLTGYMLSLIAPMPITTWQIVFGLATVICGVGVLTTIRSTGDGSPDWIKQAIILLGIWLIFVPMIIAQLSSPTVQMNVHGDFHASILNQIFHGDFPPINPQVPDAPLGYYWLYHSLLATLADLFSIPSTLVASIINCTALITTLAWTWWLLHAMDMTQRQVLLMAVLVLIVLLGGNLTGIIHWAINVDMGGIGQTGRRAMVLAGDLRLYGLLPKFINFNSFPLSLMYFIAGLYAVTQLIRGHVSFQYLYLLTFAVIGSVIFQFGTGFFLALVSGIWIIIALARRYINGFNFKIIMQSMWRDLMAFTRHYTRSILVLLVGGLILILGITVIHGLHVLSLWPESTATAFELTDNIISLVSYLYPHLPFLIIGGWLAIKYRDEVSIYLLVGFLVGMIVSIAMGLTDGNQYKFVLLTGILSGLMVVRVLVWFLQRKLYRGMIRSIIVLMYILIAFNTLLISAESILIASTGDPLYRYSGRYIIGNSRYQDSFTWIRDNTPPSTLIVQPHTMDIRYMPVYTERLPYLGYYQFAFSENEPEYARREAILNTLYDASSTPVDRQDAIEAIEALDLDRPLLLAVPHNNSVVHQFVESLNLETAHISTNATLYWLRP